jgi:hypothetical protein
MDNLLKKLLELAEKNPDGFSIVLPDGSIIQVHFVVGIATDRGKNGIRIRSMFGVILKGDFGEAFISFDIDNG